MFGNPLFNAGTKSLTLPKILNGISKTLGVVNQAIPLYNQAKPMFQKGKALLKIANELNKKDPVTPQSKTISNIPVKKNTSYNKPVFFQ